MEEAQSALSQYSYQRALEDRRQRDFDSAIANLDVCLSSNPTPGLAMIAWEALATTIIIKFDFTSFRSPLNSIEECAWVARVAQCVQNAINTYETRILNTSEAEQYRKVYELVTRHAERLATYGLTYRDEMGNKNFADPLTTIQTELPTLRCLVEQERAQRERLSNRYAS